MDLIFHTSIKYIQQSVQITEICYHYNIELIPNGNKLYAHCPFHEDSALSFVIFPKENLWKCRCGRGDIIKFVMKMEDISFKKAVRKIENLISEWIH